MKEKFEKNYRKMGVWRGLSSTYSQENILSGQLTQIGYSCSEIDHTRCK